RPARALIIAPSRSMGWPAVLPLTPCHLTELATALGRLRAIFVFAVFGFVAIVVGFGVQARALASAAQPIVVAHRGGEYNFPENTIAGLTASARKGQIVETDVRWTSDGWAVLIHDEDTARVFDCAERNWPGTGARPTAWRAIPRC
ncbi:MAG: hypothetical protein M3070_09775, partial [Actinomycetota bacterium]|nr:hypothetical protein [Actinomycetota bacterium]